MSKIPMRHLLAIPCSVEERDRSFRRYLTSAASYRLVRRVQCDTGQYPCWPPSTLTVCQGSITCRWDEDQRGQRALPTLCIMSLIGPKRLKRFLVQIAA